jgi:uncharacterized membrane protein YfcA
VIDELLLFVGGATAGLVGGYLGVGGGTILVPYLTLVTGLDIKTAVPVSLAGVAVNSVASSTPYLRMGMVDFELVVVVSVFMVMGNIAGSTLSAIVSPDVIRIIFALTLVYTAITLLRGRQETARLDFAVNRRRAILLSIPFTLLIGTLSGLVGLGGAELLIPLLYLMTVLPMGTARGTALFSVGFSAAAALAVYLTRGQIALQAIAPVVVGIVLGGRLGASFGTRARPLAVRAAFSIMLLYLAYKLGWMPLWTIM